MKTLLENVKPKWFPFLIKNKYRFFTKFLKCGICEMRNNFLTFVNKIIEINPKKIHHEKVFTF